MKYLSVCAGIEAATVAWHPLNWEPVAFSEIDAFPSAVLAHHYPDVPNWGDMTQFKTWPDADLDLLVGGTPCQSFSVAGLRKGLDDPRGNLMLTYLAIADRYRPKWLVWENVPGVLSSNGGRDFGAFLGALGQLGYGFAYRVLDALHFACALPRARVFVVGCTRGWTFAAAVLFEQKDFGYATARSAQRPRGHTLSTQNAGSRNARGNAICDGKRLRAMTPKETERCMGFPDNYTAILYRGKPADACPDSPRYKALGNSMAVPVMAWIGRRIQLVHDL
jgi:DNA (cytosine-5)-methyltransferase 1